MTESRKWHSKQKHDSKPWPPPTYFFILNYITSPSFSSQRVFTWFTWINNNKNIENGAVFFPRKATHNWTASWKFYKFSFLQPFPHPIPSYRWASRGSRGKQAWGSRLAVAKCWHFGAPHLWVLQQLGKAAILGAPLRGGVSGEQRQRHTLRLHKTLSCEMFFRKKQSNCFISQGAHWAGLRVRAAG